jgi:ABC transporter substrate binding protein
MSRSHRSPSQPTESSFASRLNRSFATQSPPKRPNRCIAPSDALGQERPRALRKISDPFRRPVAKELVDLHPDALFAITALSAVTLRQYTLTIPTVFVQVGDPVALGLVTNLARPNGNITGFTSGDFNIGSKWIETLKAQLSLSAFSLACLDGECLQDQVRDRIRV